MRRAKSYRLAPFRLCGRFLVPPSLTFPQSPFVITDGRISRVRLATLVVLRRPFRIQGSLSALPHSPLFDTVGRALLARTESPFPFSGFSPSRVRLPATWAPTQQRSLGALTRFLPRDLGLTSRSTGSARQTTPAWQLPRGDIFPGCSHPLSFSLPDSLDPQIAPSASFQAWPRRLHHASLGCLPAP